MKQGSQELASVIKQSASELSEAMGPRQETIVDLLVAEGIQGVALTNRSQLKALMQERPAEFAAAVAQSLRVLGQHLATDPTEAAVRLAKDPALLAAVLAAEPAVGLPT